MYSTYMSSKRNVWLFFSIPVFRRENSRKVEAKGLFANAKVVRGSSWRWQDQDGKHSTNVTEIL